ncbi:MAG: ABC-type multidrug transport system, ATPase component [Gemmatimonadetes bacterium]|jgi:ABC-2 type transport system ATP-binding protein|nr:ABC-type multidrug transport system, ATPase component [Gemmatimonadota bacterium]
MSALPTVLPSADLAISTVKLTKQYGEVFALRDVGLQVPAGAIYLLVGPNGAGKSTTIKILMDLMRATSGSASVFHMETRQRGAAVRANIGYVPERLDWGYGWMRVGRLLQHHASYYPQWDATYADRLVREFDVRLDQRMSTLSKGQGRRVHLLMALAHRPPLLILDEPTDGLDPVMRDETIRVLVEHLADSPTTVLLSTHHVSEVESLADHVGVLSGGELRAQLPLSALRQGIRRYRAEIPAGWDALSTFGTAVLRRATTKTEIDCTIWGHEGDIINRLASSGAAVRSANALSLDEATLALLTKPAITR